METDFQEFLREIKKIFTNRLLYLFVIFGVMFYALVVKLFDLQIVKGGEYQQTIKENRTTAVPVSAPRGTIYDRFGRPLAINKTSYIVKIDPSVKVAKPAEIFRKFIKVMEASGETIIDEFPIGLTRGDGKDEFFFDFPSDAREKRWKEDVFVPLAATPEESFKFLRDYFEIPEGTDNLEARKILSMCCDFILRRYSLEHYVVAVDIKEETVAALEENNQDFPSIYIDLQYLREYPEGETFAHILGYIRKVDSAEYEANKDKGYTESSLIGKTGLERSFELQLRGTDGQKLVEIDTSGRRVATVSETDPIQGDKITLTLDKDMQEYALRELEATLREIQISKLLRLSEKEEEITPVQLVVSMLKSGSISVSEIMKATAATAPRSFEIREYIEQNAGLDRFDIRYQTNLLNFAVEAVNEGGLRLYLFIEAMAEQGMIQLTDKEKTRVQNNSSSILTLFAGKLESGEISPKTTALDPCTGSVVLLDVNTGETIAAVGYPPYDNNELVNNFNNAYYNRLNSDSVTTPMINRPFLEPRAPGSTFKMITAAAALEEGIIGKNTTILDEGIFKKAGMPFAKCMAAAPYHGLINVITALEVSCNYFFFEVSHEMGNSKDDSLIDGISLLNKYMEMFGLNQRTGVEIFEYFDSNTANVPNMASPERKEYINALRYPNALPQQLAWVDGDTIRTAIGQGQNNYTAANMAKYIATIAANGARYQTRLVRSVESANGEITEFTPNLELNADISEKTFAIIQEGMYNVTHGSRGTARGVFADFPVAVAGKTGTTEETGKLDHISFGGYAPYDDPQVAVYVMIPSGQNALISAPAAVVARNVLAKYFGLYNEPQPTRLAGELVK